MKVLHRNTDRLEYELLLAHVLGKDRAWLLAHPDAGLSSEQSKRLDALLQRRRHHEPIAYLTNEKEFYGRLFFVDERVLVPRPATETLIDEVKNVCESNFEIESPRIKEADTSIVIYSELMKMKDEGTTLNDVVIVDIGTGSGCIGITLACEFPGATIVCTDTSRDAIEVARHNATRHGVQNRIEFIEADYIPKQLSSSNVHPSTFLVVSNPPYIPDSESLPSDITNFEPHEALFGGPAGMDIILELYQQCKTHPQCIGFVAEMRHEQAKKLKNTS